MDIPDNSPSPRFVVPNLRWWIGGLLFASTVINYIDRQTLNVLAPYLKAEYHWTNSDFALIVIAFRASYAVVQLDRRPAGRRAGHAARVGPRGRVVLGDGHADVAGERPRELLRVPVPAGCRRGGELARRDQGRLRMVPGQGARPRGGALRQRLGDRRRRSRRRSWCGSSMPSAPGVRRSWSPVRWASCGWSRGWRSTAGRRSIRISAIPSVP